MHKYKTQSTKKQRGKQQLDKYVFKSTAEIKNVKDQDEARL